MGRGVVLRCEVVRGGLRMGKGRGGRWGREGKGRQEGNFPDIELDGWMDWMRLIEWVDARCRV